ncbi:hypothetical protein [Ruminococcus sp. BSD2780120874_150323_B10]|uniref:hypothetical protein n=1 Tax=Ruminococcus sp. BSD2780120874_150323_B10 TaxID=2787127 RepID=UPI0018994B12|nr:hypothetical protein [Ruminococcus sp. BSD2780120874_150323_B10]
MTAKEIKEINREISRLRAKIVRISAEADNTAGTLGERIVPSGQTSDKVGNAVVQIADIQREIQNLEIRRNAALNSLSRDDFVENCLFMHLSLRYSWAKIAVDTGGINTPDNIRKMCNRYHW